MASASASAFAAPPASRWTGPLAPRGAPRFAPNRCPKPQRPGPARDARPPPRPRRPSRRASAADATSPSAASLDSFAPGDLLRLEPLAADDASAPPSVAAAASAPLLRREWFLEVLRVAPDGASLVGLARGAAFVLTAEVSSPPDSSARFRLAPAPAPDQPSLATEPWVRDAFPAWRALLADLQSDRIYPPDPAALLLGSSPGSSPGNDPPPALEVLRVSRLTSYADLRAAVAADASFWTDGTPANAPPMTPSQQATLNAGELLAFLVGARGVVMTQLWAGWNVPSGGDASSGGGGGDALQPVDAPFVARALREMASEAAAGRVGVLCCAIEGVSTRRGGGLTATAHANAAPWAQRAAHLASFGAQAALVAGSPYYQLLVGTILGYTRENVDAHVAEKGGRVTRAVASEVEKELAALSDAEARTPWRDGYEGAFEPDRGREGEGAGSRGKRGGRKDAKKTKLARGGNRKKNKKKGDAGSPGRSVEDVEAMFGGRGRR